mmetsp:Transcript_22874/g.28007  ORF Transcript_22874/g.28007 Transcript_22874/m.28007 type:complete len:382 (-) Transcript_22874:278-1423(-)|eukprot:CAMPEP_0204830260 /NCGR_PEP_ID=MMETSP1346-20131115/8430_1 /ASSEMBLY_ACC=CAM_ASM_000771 /TAXON_ID=215587 /ORGANISM="Aplanochytrium stocchinoi, Strain GSBS06" /LENGTH=381 /DNA_ID=CAMNT_0051960423 /DNA_START=269 /DNA_END=1414 /DNA_ORIENTATION=-
MSAYTVRERLLGALFYAASSILLMMVNKYLLSVWDFPSSSFVALSQFGSTLVNLHVLKKLNYIDFPDLDYETVVEVFPLPLLFLGNTVCGLYGTQAISIPMFGVLRRLNMLFTMVLEFIILHYAFSTDVAVSVAVILGGSVIAAYDDLAFDLYGYFIILLNNIFTSLMGVVSKQKLNKTSVDDNAPNKQKTEGSESERLVDSNSLGDGKMTTAGTAGPVSPTKSKLKGLGTWGLMFYNALFSFPILLLFFMTVGKDDITQVLAYQHWKNATFLGLFICSSVMGTILQFSILYCTKVNSALTTVVTGCTKNVLTTYMGMVMPGMDYVFSWLNFIGVNISMFGGLYYAKIQYDKKQAKQNNDVKKDLEMNGQARSQRGTSDAK